MHEPAKVSVMQFLKIVMSCCFCIYQYYSLFLGVNTMRYDRQQRRVVRSRLKTTYSRCANIALVVGMCFGYYKMFLLPAATYTRGHEVLRFMDLLNIAVQFGMTMWMFLLRFQREHKYMEILMRFYDIDDDYMQRLAADATVERAVLRVLCAKLLVMLTRMIMALLIPLHMASQLTWQNCCLIVYFANMQNFLPAIVFRYFIALVQAWKRFKLLNFELQRLLAKCDATAMPQTPTQTQAETATTTATTTRELWQLVCVHWQFSQLLQLLSDTYKYQMIGTLVTYMIRSVVFSFFLTLIIAGRIQTDTATIALGLLTFCAIYIDIYLLYWICELLERVYAETTSILRQHDATSCVAPVEWLSLQLTQSRLHISMGGMFNLNMRALLSFLAYILQQTLIWVQFDWSYYKRQGIRQS